MPDDRLIHLALGHSQKINALTDFERGVWLIYKLTSDDFGVMRFSPVTLQEAAGWLECKPAKVVLRAMEAVHEAGLVQTFTHQDRAYCFQPDWQTWQKITHPRQTKQPCPPIDLCDANTRWLLAHHPKGGRLKSWQAPAEKPEDAGRPPEVQPEETRPVVVDVGSGGVGVRESGGQRRAIQSGGAGAGSFPRDHVNCRPPCVRVCITEKQFALLVQNHGGPEDEAERFVARWLSEKRAAFPAGPIGGEKPWAMWERLWNADFPSAAALSGQGKTAGNLGNLQRFAAKGRV